MKPPNSRSKIGKPVTAPGFFPAAVKSRLIFSSANQAAAMEERGFPESGAVGGKMMGSGAVPNFGRLFSLCMDMMLKFPSYGQSRFVSPLNW
jgi:hypothetical protein